MEWNNTLCGSYPFDKTCTAITLPMCIFGQNGARLSAIDGDPYPSCYPYACGYIGSYVLGAVGFVLYGSLGASIFHKQLADATIYTLAHIGGPVCLGCYAGRYRTAIRNKYNLYGHPFSDCLTHAIVSPCALCQESHEIEYQSRHHDIENNNITVINAPYAPLMENLKGDPLY